MSDHSEYEEFDYAELQAEAKSRDLPASGNTQDLISRLEADDAEFEEQSPEDTVTEAAPDNEPDDDGFVGVSNEHKHAPASIHYSPKPSSYSDEG